MRISLCCVLFAVVPAAAGPKPVAGGLKTPMAAAFGPEKKLYVLEAGAKRISVIDNGVVKPFAEGFEEPADMVYCKFQNAFYVADRTSVKRVDAKGKVSVEMPASRFPQPPKNLHSLAIEENSGGLFVADSNNVWRFAIKAKQFPLTLVADSKLIPGLTRVSGLTSDGGSYVLIADGSTGIIHRMNLETKTATKAFDSLMPGRMLWDPYGRLFISNVKGLTAIPKPGVQAITIPDTSADSNLALGAGGSDILLVNAMKGTITSIPATIPGWEVDDSPIAVECKPAFPKLKFTGWDDGSETGKAIPLRPIVLTHAGDGSGRNFVAIQQGTIHVFPNDDNAEKTKVFLDITKRVRYLEKQNEEGLLGLAFHPKYKTNGEFFVFYTDVAAAKQTNVVSRFRVKKDNPDEADPASEEILLKIEKPYWNHDGGTIAFGPDGYLYITHGDGGLGSDPHENGQNLGTHLGKILRIDVDKKTDGRNYAIPADNPFISTPNAKPEIYAYGIRNIWRFAFDRPTGKLWAGEVGQNLFEEINIIEKGGNYGWSVRESFHPFGKKGMDVNSKIIDPIWEYHHDIGKSITGGHVYRGMAIPELIGHYLYADYVTTRLWALKYDDAKKRVTANRPIASPNVAVMSFGEDEKGESYILGASPAGKGIHRLVKVGN